MVFLEIINNEYVRALIIIVGFILIAQIFNLILQRYLKKIIAKTKSDIDDRIIKHLEGQLYIFIILIGLYYALQTLSVLKNYNNFINNAFFAIIVVWAAMIFSQFFTFFIGRWLKVKKRFEKTPYIISSATSIVIYFIAFLIVLDHFNVEITPLIATLGIGGLAIGLALQNTLSNFFAGIHIISDRPINIGDFIEIPDSNVSGYVENIGWRSTKIKTLPSTIVVVPNSKLAESVIINDSLPQEEMAALVQCGVSYKSDLKKVEKITIEVAKKIQKTVQGAVKDFEPFIRYHTFGDSNINFTIILRVEKFVDKYLVKHEFIKALKERYDKENIEISWPVRKIYYGKEKVLREKTAKSQATKS